MAIGDPQSTMEQSPVITAVNIPVGSPVSVIVEGDAPQPTPSTAPVNVLTSTPDAPIPAVPLSFSPPWLQDPMRHKAMMTPPCPVRPEQLVTPEIEVLHTHVSIYKKTITALSKKDWH